MPSQQASKNPADVETLAQGGTGPEYAYPTTKKHEQVPVVNPSTEDYSEVSAEDDPAVAPAEDAPPLKDSEIAREEQLENEEAGEWSEDLAENEPRPEEKLYVDPDMAPTPVDEG
ncbi:hypothetical protein R1flu_010153 [Riccia fluitans]|uniref:Uncharacterized protein n=1 Tax=Riccia fluitans TaxID=41844 RepID=A0ABD1Z465_9MARC